MNINKNDDIKNRILNSIRENWKNDRGMEIHVSDCLAPRKAWFQRFRPLPPTDDEIMYWLTGKGHELVLSKASGFKHVESREKEGIVYSIDFYIDVPTELKTRRKGLPEAAFEKEYEHYLKQLVAYCSLEESLNGNLLVWCLTNEQEDRSTKPELAAYVVEFTENELNQAKSQLIEIKEKLKTAFEDALQGFKNLPHCPGWMCGRVSRVMTIQPHCETCGRDFATEWGAQKHSEGKKTLGHKIIPPKYDFSYDKKCQWWDECDPKLVQQLVDPAWGRTGG